ncbi:MAG: radical SAM protein [Alcanivoracaceae bacterium]|nr:radical SAM protein [Alcanivoracaceae bacterium]
MNKSFTTQELVIHLTLRCPLKCAHCCVDADINKSEELQYNTVLKSIINSAKIPTIEKVSFTGGDPFVSRKTLEAGIKQATSQGLSTSVVTSAFWAKTAKRAEHIIETLKDAGLKEIMLSYDDSHAQYLEEHFIINAFNASVKAGLIVKVNVVREPNDKIDKAYLTAILDPNDSYKNQLKIFETAVNSTGRAKEDDSVQMRQDRAANDQVYRGSCTSVLRHISAQSDGNWVPCCGVIKPPKALHMGQVDSTSLETVVKQAHKDPVLQWLAYEGPVAILKQITATTDNPLEDADFDGICHACDRLFNEPAHRKLLAKALPNKIHSLTIQHLIYEQIGLNAPPECTQINTNKEQAEVIHE